MIRTPFMTSSNSPNSVAWLLFMAGVASVPIWTLALSGHRSSVADHKAMMVLWGMSLLACVLAPFLSSAPAGKKLGLAVLALLAFVVSLVLSWAMLFAVRGVPVG